jgi:hypothetical protein
MGTLNEWLASLPGVEAAINIYAIEVNRSLELLIY